MRFDPYDVSVGWHRNRANDFHMMYRKQNKRFSPLSNAEVHAIVELHIDTPMDTGEYRPVHDWIKAHQRIVLDAMHIATVERNRVIHARLCA